MSMHSLNWIQIEVHRYLGNKPVTEKQQIIDVIHYVRSQYSEHGIGRWAVVLKETNEFIRLVGTKMGY